MKIEPITMPGSVCGRITSRNVRHQFAAEIARRLERSAVDLRQREEERRDHEQDVELDQRQVTAKLEKREDVERSSTPN